MKKYLIVLSFFFTTSVMQGQVLISLLLGDYLNSGLLEFGLEGGFSGSNITGLDSKKYMRNYNLGFYFDIKINSPWYFYTGVLVKSNLGTDLLSQNDLARLSITPSTHEGGEYSQITKTFQVPFLMKYRFKNNFFLLAGIQAGLLYNAWVEFNLEKDGEEIRVRHYNEGDLNKIDVGVMAGLGYKIKDEKDHGLSFSFRYYYGFVDVYKEISGTKYNSYYVEMTIPIGAE
jgi:hypothetical protein